jgi:hypothetical protein
MNQSLIIIPVFAQVLLTLAVMFVMGARRRKALVSRTTRLKDIALGQDAWPEDAIKAANNYKNLFEMPVLFFAACAFALITRTVDVWMLALAAAYVAARVLHSIIHLGANPVMPRAYAFFSSALILLAMWIVIFARTLQQAL